MCSGFNCDCLVNDVAFNAGGRCEADLQAAHPANHTAVHNNIIGNDFTFHCGTFANRQKVRADVTVYLAFDIDITCCFQVTGDQQICG